MNKINNQFTSIEQVSSQYLNSQGEIHSSSKSEVSFEQVLNQSQDTSQSKVKFSKHAASRLQTRDITLSAEQKERLEAGVQKASEKGINESLIMVDSLAFIVNIPNKTVITAMDQMESDDSIFTNIDGAVIM